MLTKIRRNVVAGILTFIPIWITFWVISFLVGVLVALGSPLVSWCVSSLGIHSPTLAEGRSAQWFQGRSRWPSSSPDFTCSVKLRPRSQDDDCWPRSTT